jgi:hypothetical protein
VYYVDGAQPSEQPSNADDPMQVPDAARHADVECVGGCQQPSSNLYFIIATIMIIIIKAI